MAEESAKLRIPYIAAAQAQKHVTHNEAVTLLDTLVQLSVLDKDLTTPPGSPVEGDTYIVASGATDAWLGWDNRVARYIDGEWRSYLPGEGDGAGWLAWVLDEDAMYRFDGAAWALAGIEGPEGPEGPAGADGADGADGQSFQPDAVVALIAGRDTYDDEAAAFPVLVVADSTNSDQPTLYFKLSAGSADWSDPMTWGPAGGGGGSIVAPQGRLTLTTGTPVLSASVSAAAIIYYTPYLGRSVPIYDGAAWANHEIDELSLALDSDAGHAGYHQASKNFDLFVFDDSGTERLGSGPAWTDDTTRAAGLTRLDGFRVNTATITLRFGSAMGDTVSVPANRATYVGTFRAIANGQTEFVFPVSATTPTAGSFLLWNEFNRTPLGVSLQDTSSSWTYNSTTPREVAGNSTFEVRFVTGAQQTIALYAQGNCTASSGSVVIRIGFGLDATNTIQDPVAQPVAVANTFSISSTEYRWAVEGYHFVALTERINTGSDSVTVFGLWCGLTVDMEL